MKKKNGLKSGVIAFLSLCAIFTLNVNADEIAGKDRKVVLREVFDSGIKSTLKVLKYEKEKSLSTSELDIKGKYCISLNRSGSQTIKPFDVVKMESLSLHLEYEPMYLLYASNGESHNIFCFAQGETKKEAKAKLKAIQARYPRIDEYNPRIDKLTKQGTYKRTIPFLGVWSKDMGKTVEILNEELEKKTQIISSQRGAVRQIEKNFSEFSKKMKKEINNAVSMKKPSSKKDDDFESDFSSPSVKKSAPIETKEVVTPKKKTIKKVVAKKVVVGNKDRVKKSSESDRVFTLKKK